MHRIHNIMFFENYYAFFSWYAHPLRVPIGLKSTLIQDATLKWIDVSGNATPYFPVYRILTVNAVEICGELRCPAHVPFQSIVERPNSLFDALEEL